MKSEVRYTKGDKTKQMVIKEAARVFNKYGYVGTSVSDLTRATGLTSGAIYGSFKGKKDLAGQAFDYNSDKLLSGYKNCLDKGSAKEQLFRLIDFPAKGMAPVFDEGCPILNMGVEADDTLPWMREKVLKTLHSLVQLFKKVLDDGCSNGEFIKIDTQGYSLFLISAIEGSIMMAKTMQDINLILNTSDQLKRDVEQRILTK